MFKIYKNKKIANYIRCATANGCLTNYATLRRSPRTGHVWKLEVCYSYYYYYYADHRRLGLNIAIYLSIIHCSWLDTAMVILNIYIQNCVYNIYIYIYLCIIIIGTQQINLPHETVMHGYGVGPR